MCLYQVEELPFYSRFVENLYYEGQLPFLKNISIEMITWLLTHFMFIFK